MWLNGIVWLKYVTNIIKENMVPLDEIRHAIREFRSRIYSPDVQFMLQNYRPQLQALFSKLSRENTTLTAGVCISKSQFLSLLSRCAVIHPGYDPLVPSSFVPAPTALQSGALFTPEYVAAIFEALQHGDTGSGSGETVQQLSHYSMTEAVLYLDEGKEFSEPFSGSNTKEPLSARNEKQSKSFVKMGEEDMGNWEFEEMLVALAMSAYPNPYVPLAQKLQAFLTRYILSVNLDQSESAQIQSTNDQTKQKRSGRSAKAQFKLAASAAMAFSKTKGNVRIHKIARRASNPDIDKISSPGLPRTSPQSLPGASPSPDAVLFAPNSFVPVFESTQQQLSD